MAYFLLFLLFAALIGLGLLLLRLMMDRAIKAVIKTFREKGALDAENAKSGSELGLKAISETRMIDGIFKTRDYKPYVFDSLLQVEIIRVTEDGRYYLSEQALQASNLAKYG